METDKPIGRTCWVVPDGCIPQIMEHDRDNRSGYLSHECACILNAGPRDARIELTIYFEDRDPKTVEGILVPARRSLHLRMDRLAEQDRPLIPRNAPYSLILRSSEPVFVQMSRLDTTQPNMAFLSTMAYPLDDRR